MNVSSTFKLNNGNEIPVMALGSWDSRGDEAYQACLDALSSGYRHIDTAAYYENEALVGAAVRDCEIPREEIFVTSKMWYEDMVEGKQEADSYILDQSLFIIFLKNFPGTFDIIDRPV